MDDLRSLTKTIRPSSRTALEILAYLHQLSRDTAEGNVTAVLSTAVELPIRCLGVEKALLLRPSGVDEFCVPLASRNVSQSFIDNCQALAVDDTVRWVLANQTPKTIEDVSSLPRTCARLYSDEDVSSLAYIPVVPQDQPPAVLVYMCSSPDSFTVGAVETMCTIANHVAAVFRLEHVTARETAQPRTRSFERITPMEGGWRDTDSAASDLNSVLDCALNEILEVLTADSGSIMLCEHGRCRLAISRGLPSDRFPDSQAIGDGGVATRVIAGRKPVLLHGPVSEQDFPCSVPREDIISAMSIPLRGRRRIIGLLNINSTTAGRWFRDHELAVASTMAHQIAMAVENAKLHEAARTQTRYLGNLYKIARTITSTLQLDAVLEMIMERLRTLIRSDVCALLLHDRETGRIQLASGYGITCGTEQDYIDLIRPALGQSSSARPTVVPDLTVDPMYAHSALARSLGLRSAAIAPLTIKRKVVGYVAAYRREPQGFPRPIVRLLLGLIELAAIAIENARLYERQSGIADIAQRELTPQRLGPVPGFEIGYKYAPAGQVGGDYYDVIRLDKDRFALVLADVSGKSVSAAVHIAMCKHSLRALAPHIGSPAALLRRMNTLIYHETEPEAFISMFYAVLDTRRRRIVYASAGHEPGLLLRARTKQVDYINTPGILLGVIPDATFAERKASIEVGDVLLLYTDGLIDALSRIGIDGLTALEFALSNYELQTAQALADNVHRLAVAKHPGKSPDDIALLVLKKM